jgi:hypothetical protein
MTDKKGRLAKLYSGLSARERGVLVLQAMKRGVDEDPQVRTTMPHHQISEFNRYISLMSGVRDLSTFVVATRALLDQISIRLGWLLTLDLFSGDERTSKKKPARCKGLEEALCYALRRDMRARWIELRAVETVLKEVAGEFDGEDPADPTIRDMLEDMRRELEELAETLQVRIGKLDLPEPNDDLLTKLRTVAELNE